MRIAGPAETMDPRKRIGSWRASVPTARPVRVAWLLACLLVTTSHGQEPEQLLRAPLAEAFGSAPLMRGVRLSPDGSRISYIQSDTGGRDLLSVFDTRTGTVASAMASEPNGYVLRWCGWANDERLLCSLRFIEELNGLKVARSRLAAVDADGSNAVLLLQNDRELRTLQFQDNIVDWLPDDPEHVLLGLRISRFASLRTLGLSRTGSALTGSRVVRLNIYDSTVESTGTEQGGALDWITDGHGTTRLRVSVSSTHRTWEVREREDGAWLDLHRAPLTDLDDEFSPVAFDRDANEVIFYDRHEGRTALFALELDNDRARRLIYAHPSVDLSGVFRLGRYNRIVGTVAIEDRPVLRFFEPEIHRVHDMLVDEFPGKMVSVIDEDWLERRYLEANELRSLAIEHVIGAGVVTAGCS